MDALRIALQSPAPEDVQDCLPTLEETVASLQELVRDLQGQGERQVKAPQVEEQAYFTLQLHALNSSLEVAQHLVMHGQTFCDGWARVLGSATGGYQPSGDPAPLSAPGTLSIKG